MTKPAPDRWIFSPDIAVEGAVAAILEAYPPVMRGTLDNVRAVLKKLGDPHLSLPPVFHAAGTNGKGSTLAFVQAIFEAGGKKVHKFTSPHLVRFEERFVFGNKDVEPGALLALIDECAAVANGAPISFFEFFTILFFLGAARYPADAVLLETGLGGTFDSTNVVEKNACAILTRISFDHTHILGNTLPEIASQKAGIIKKHCPVVIAPQPDAAVMKVFLDEAARLQSSVGSRDPKISFPPPALAGAHQVTNAATAIAAIAQTEFRNILTPDVLSHAMKNVHWPGRLQKLASGKLSALLPTGWEIWLDGAHNDSGAEVLLAEVQTWDDGKPLHFITAFKDKKDPADFYAPFKGKVASVQVITQSLLSDMPGVPFVPPFDLCAALENMGFAAKTAENLESALQSLAFQYKTPQRILVTGSLYLVGHTLKVNA